MGGWVMSRAICSMIPSSRARQNFPKFKGALRAICMSDDTWATRPAIDLLCSGFTATSPEIISITPEDVGVPKSAISDFFRPEHRDTLWRGAAEWIEAAG